MKLEEHHRPFRRGEAWPEDWPPIVAYSADPAPSHRTPCDHCQRKTVCATVVETVDLAFWCCTMACAERLMVKMLAMGYEDNEALLRLQETMR